MSWLLSHSGVPVCVADIALESCVWAVEPNPDVDKVRMRLDVSDKQKDVAKTAVDECRAVRRVNERSSISDLTIRRSDDVVERHKDERLETTARHGRGRPGSTRP